MRSQPWKAQQHPGPDRWHASRDSPVRDFCSDRRLQNLGGGTGNVTRRDSEGNQWQVRQAHQAEGRPTSSGSTAAPAES